MLVSRLIGALATIASLGLGGLAQAQTFAISDVEVTPLATSNLCAALGGAGAPPHIEIRHSPIGGVAIHIHMEDRPSGAAVVNHGSTTILSSASGTTVATPNFLSPCNRTHRLTSHYVIKVSVKGQAIERSFGGYDSARGAIISEAEPETPAAAAADGATCVLRAEASRDSSVCLVFNGYAGGRYVGPFHVGTGAGRRYVSAGGSCPSTYAAGRQRSTNQIEVDGVVYSLAPDCRTATKAL